MSGQIPILAASGDSGSTLFILLAIVVSIIRWLSSRQEKTAPQKPSAPGSSSRSSNSDSEQEQMRRFLEALGLPPDSASAPSPPPVPVERPRPVPQPQVRAQIPPRPVMPRKEEEPAYLPIEQIENPHLSDLQVPEVAAFQTVASVVSAIPFEAVGHVSGEMAPVGPRNVSESAAEARKMLRSPGALRTAFVLREILGPPRGLQSSDIPHSFPSL